MYALIKTVAMSAMAATLVASPTHAKASPPIATSAYGHPQAMFWPGEHLTLTTGPLPSGSLCVGLASRLDRGGLPLTVGPVHRTRTGTTATITIPAHLLHAEPEGPWLLFVGHCTSVAVDMPIVASTTIGVEPLPQSEDAAIGQPGH